MVTVSVCAILCYLDRINQSERLGAAIDRSEGGDGSENRCRGTQMTGGTIFWSLERSKNSCLFGLASAKLRAPQY